MTPRAAKIWFIVVLAAVLVAMLVFKVRIAVLNFKYLIVLLALVGVVALVTKKRS